MASCKSTTATLSTYKLLILTLPCQLTRDDAIKAQNAFVSYCVSKKVGEKAIWDFVENEKPSFTVTNFMPPLIMGPPLQKVRDLTNINLSVNFVHHVFDGTTDTVPSTMFPGYV
jgi:nucleoside-diphosphate-sugar epimerase